MYMQCGDLALKKLAVFGIQQVLLINSSKYSPQIIAQLQQWLIQTLQIETNESLWRFLCDIASLIVKYWPDFNNEPLYQLANQLLSNPNQQAIGLCLWEKIFPQEKENISERTINLIKELFIVASQSLINQNQSIRQSAFELIDTLMWKLGYQNVDIEKNQELMQILANVVIALTRYVEIIFKSNAVNAELQTFVMKYSEVFDAEISFFSNNSTPIIEAAIMAIANPEIPVNVRIYIHSLIDASFNSYQKTDKSTFIILNYTVQLALASCHENRQEDEYTFAEDFFNQVIETEAGVFVFFEDTIQQLAQSNDICNRQVALLLIKSSISGMNIEKAKIYLNICLQISDCGDEALVLACCATISDFISHMKELIILVFDPLSKFLVKYARFPLAMFDLCRSIKAIQQPPQYFANLIELLLSSLPQANVMQATEILYCVKSCFSGLNYFSPYIPAIDCTKIFAVLSSAINLHEEYRTVVLGLFGNLVAAAPLLIRQNLENIVTICRACMQNFLNPTFSAAVKCIRKLVSYLPKSIAPLLPQLIPPMLEIITMKEPNIPEMKIEGVIDSFKKTKCETMKCLCVIGSEIDDFGNQYCKLLWNCTNSQSQINDQIQASMNPEYQNINELRKQQEMMQNHLQSDLPDKDENQLSMSSKILISGAKLFSKKNFRIPSVLNQLINSLQTCEDFDALVLVLRAIRELILFTPHEAFLDANFRNQIGDALIHASAGIYYNFIKQQSSTIPKFLRRVLFGTLIAFADTCREFLVGSANEFYKSLIYDLAEPGKLQCALILHFLSKVFMYCNIVDDELLGSIFEKIYETIQFFQDYNFINYEILTHAFSSFICIFRIKKEKFANNVGNIIMYIQSFIHNNQIENPEFKLSYQTLYLTLISLYQIPINEDVKMLYNEIKPFRNYELLPFIADCFIYGFKVIGNDMLPILARFSTILFSSEKWILDMINRETLMFYFNIIGSIPQEELVNYSNFNESSIHQIIQNMQICAG